MFNYDKETRTLVLEGAGEFDETREIEHISPLTLDGCTFYVRVGERQVGSLRLLESGASSPEEVSELSRILTSLRRKTPVLMVEGRQTSTDKAVIRKRWVAELRAAESRASEALRLHLQNEGVGAYVRQ